MRYSLILIAILLAACGKPISNDIIKKSFKENTSPVKEADFSLSLCIDSAIRKAGGDITLVKKLVCQTGGVKSLKGINQLTHLEELYLQNNRMNSLADLGNMPTLRIISVAGNKELKSLTGLEFATNLQELQANKAKNLQDISAVKRLTQLKIIAIMMADISNISALSELEKLEEVNFNYNKIKDISALQNKPKLKSLSLYSNQIVSLKPLVGNSSMLLVGVGGKDISHCDALIELDKTLKADARLYGPEQCGVNAQ